MNTEEVLRQILNTLLHIEVLIAGVVIYRIVKFFRG